MLRTIWYLSKANEISSPTHKTGSQGILSKFLMSMAVFFYTGVFPGVKKIAGKVCLNPLEHVELVKLNERVFRRDAQRVCQAERSLMRPLAETKRAS